MEYFLNQNQCKIPMNSSKKSKLCMKTGYSLSYLPHDQLSLGSSKTWLTKIGSWPVGCSWQTWWLSFSFLHKILINTKIKLASSQWNDLVTYINQLIRVNITSEETGWCHMPPDVTHWEGHEYCSCAISPQNSDFESNQGRLKPMLRNILQKE